MKYFAVFILSLGLQFTNAQNYTPLLSPQNTWTVEYVDYLQFPYRIEKVTYRHEGDTTINNHTYKIYGKEVWPFSGPAYLREDNTQKKVFQYSASSSEECVLYDFSAQAGDTLHLCHFIIVIDSIGTTTLSNGDVRKILYHHGTVDGTYYIEGVGSDVGFLEISEPIGPPSVEMMCYKNGEEDIFGDRCGEVSSILETASFSNRSLVYPNPGSGSIKFKQKISPNVRYVIRNTLGAEIQKGTYENTAIDIQFLKPSIYFIEIIDEDNQSIQKAKFVVK